MTAAPLVLAVAAVFPVTGVVKQVTYGRARAGTGTIAHATGGAGHLARMTGGDTSG